MQIIVLNHPGLIHVGYEPHFLAHAISLPCKILKIINTFDRRTEREIEKEPRFIRTGNAANLLIKPSKPICVQEFQALPHCGRFALRDIRITVAVGIVTGLNYYIPPLPKWKDLRVFLIAWKKEAGCSFHNTVLPLELLQLIIEFAYEQSLPKPLRVI